MLENFKMPKKFKSSRLTAHKRTHADDHELYDVIETHRKHISNYLLWADRLNDLTNTIAVTAEEIKKWDNNQGFYYLIKNDKNKIVGGIYLINVDLANHNIEIGYWLSGDATGQGYATEIVNAMVKLLKRKGMKRIIIKCEADNERSNKVARRCGFQLEGIMRKYRIRRNKFRDGSLYSKIFD